MLSPYPVHCMRLNASTSLLGAIKNKIPIFLCSHLSLFPSSPSTQPILAMARCTSPSANPHTKKLALRISGLPNHSKLPAISSPRVTSGTFISSEVQNKMIFMGHQISSCHIPVVRSFFILWKMLLSSLNLPYDHLSWKCRHFGCLQKVNFEDMSACCPNVSACHGQHVADIATFDVFFHIICHVVLLIADMSAMQQQASAREVWQERRQCNESSVRSSNATKNDKTTALSGGRGNGQRWRWQQMRGNGKYNN